MAMIKCKMCGGNIEVNTDKTYGTCDSCGSTMTLPRISDQRMENLFNRANHFRMICEFDKAVATYDMILNEDVSNAEAHWGLLISRLGIEYVEDPVSHERIPTSHRIQKDSILSDSDYLAALQYAPDDHTRTLYEEEGKRLAELQRSMLAVSAQSEPYDIFICYKETDASGGRTKDSALAQDMYYQLKNAGYRVFFARVSLEDKLGQQYEPHIFAALNSAKVMLVIGTNPEYFNAVWVKNEWSRFLALAKNDRSKVLIPCYRDINVYELPDELSMLQSQDMGKIGFMQDLLRGIQKLLADKHEPSTPHREQIQFNASNVSALVERVNLFLEDGKWEDAEKYCERILDQDPHNAEAYANKILIKLKVQKIEDLPKQIYHFEEDGDYQKALRYASGWLKRLLIECPRLTKEKEERESKEAKEKAEREAQAAKEKLKTQNQQQYLNACNLMNNAVNETDYLKAADIFGKITDYLDAALLQKKCVSRAETIQKTHLYESALYKMRRKSTVTELREAIQTLKALGDWKNAPKQLAKAEKRLNNLISKLRSQKLWLKVNNFCVTLFMIGCLLMVLTGILMNSFEEAFLFFVILSLAMIIIKILIKSKLKKCLEQIKTI